MKRQTFAVDASLLEELGERLIGRAPIALAELVKNSYDADAATCLIEFGPDEITISDDGTGISEREFLQYWMRLGTTHKIDKRVSEGGRSLTGSKGIGRLSVQFLAKEMVLESTSTAAPGTTLLAVVDWGTIVRGEDLSTVEVEWDHIPDKSTYANGSETGTRIVLKQLKNEWDEEALETLGREVWQLRSPFRRSRKDTVRRNPEYFHIEVEAPEIENARQAFDKVQNILFENWKARIRGSLSSGRTGQEAVVSIDFKSDYPESGIKEETYRERMQLPIRPDGGTDHPLLDQVQFEILVFKTEGRQPGNIPVAEMRKYLAEFGNVSVYDAGFRLPYYGSGTAGQDWLNLAIDQGRRLNQSELLPQHLRTANRYMLDLPAPGRIFGAVDINTNHERAAALRSRLEGAGEWLQIQPGRDRLHDNEAFAQLRDFVRFSIDLYANRHRLRALQAVERKREQESASEKYDRVLTALDRSRDDIPAALYQELKREARDARSASKTEEKLQDRRAALLAPLATAGMAALALNHELDREGRFLEMVGSKLKTLGATYDLPELLELSSDFVEARERLDSLKDLFAPLLSEVDTTADSRLRAKAVVNHTVDAVKILTPRVQYDSSRIPSDLRFPVGSLAEWNAVLQNAITNAWNAMLNAPELRVSFAGGREENGKEWLRVSDTGAGIGVPLKEASSLFEPFERRLQVDPDQQSLMIGGQGLGLAIVRMIAARRKTKVAFISPEAGYSTTLEFSWRGGSE